MGKQAREPQGPAPFTALERLARPHHHHFPVWDQYAAPVPGLIRLPGLCGLPRSPLIKHSLGTYCMHSAVPVKEMDPAPQGYLHGADG